MGSISLTNPVLRVLRKPSPRQSERTAATVAATTRLAATTSAMIVTNCSVVVISTNPGAA
jgi:hypothetical protein